jgi:hypothetical protein
MFESTLRPTQSVWLYMAILVHCASANESELQQDSATHRLGQVGAVSADSIPPRNEPSVFAADTQPLSDVVHHAPEADEDALPENLPPAIASELKRIEAMRLEIETGTPIKRWRFDGVRARYQGLLKTAPGEPVLKEAIRIRLERLTQREQAARAAATIQAILAQSHKRDSEVVELRRQLQTSAGIRRRSRAYEAIGFMQSSAQKIDGHKLFVLIGKNGGTVAYLDIPPGLDPEPVLARKVGVRGVAHYNEELHSRLITVRDVQAIEARR